MQLRGPLSSGWALNSFVHHLEKRKSNCIAVGFFPIGLLPLSNLAMNIEPWGLGFCLCLSVLSPFHLKQSSARYRIVVIGIHCAAAPFANCIVTAQDDGLYKSVFAGSRQTLTFHLRPERWQSASRPRGFPESPGGKYPRAIRRPGRTGSAVAPWFPRR